MNYKTLIAFLGKNQMKDWATPKSEWILINKPEGKGWLPIAYEMGIITDTDGHVLDGPFSGKSYLETHEGFAKLDGEVLIIRTGGGRWADSEWQDTYYNKDKKFSLSTQHGVDEDLLNKATSILDEKEYPIRKNDIQFAKTRR
jgi:hypothetical protein